MSRRDTVRTNYDAIKALIDNHKVYRGNNTSFCIDMGFEKRTSWVSDLKRNRNFPSPEEAALMCQLLNTTPEKILLHEGKDEKETAKCQEDIKRVRELLEQAEQKENAPDPKIEGARGAKQALMDAIDDLTNEQCEKLLPIVLSAKTVL